MASGLFTNETKVMEYTFQCMEGEGHPFLEELGLWEITNEVYTIPSYHFLLDEYNRKNVKARHILLDSVKYHLMPHVIGKKHAYEKWNTLIKLFQDDNQNRKMVLR